MAIKLGITGGIGSGKSCVSNLLRVMGVPVYDCDKEASRLMNSSEKIRRELIRLAGSDVYDEQEKLNRRLLAAYMFGHADRVEKVNAIVHPSVREDFSRWAAEREGERVVALESAILYEAGMSGDVDAVVLVYTPAEERLRRAMERDDASAEQVRRRMESQTPDEEKMERADFVIRNAEDDAVTPQVVNLLRTLEKTSRKGEEPSCRIHAEK